MATARDIIKGSLRLIGALATGETPSADEQADALFALNDLLGSWSLEGLMTYFQDRQVFNLVAGQYAYTMGVGGNFNTARPSQIYQGSILLNGSPNFENPLDQLTTEEYHSISNKLVQAAIPQKFFMDGANPLTNIYLWPVPSVAQTIVLYTWSPFSTITNLSADIGLPPGYSRAIRYALAVELAAEYGRTVTQDVMQHAIEAKENIKRLNSEDQYMESDALFLSTGGASFNYLTGE